MRTVIVVPCFNEAGRLDVTSFACLAERPDLALLLVDDGSTDSTFSVLDAIRREAPDGSVQVMRLGQNQGKGEAVRRGMLRAAADAGVKVVGFVDADLSTPADEVLRLVHLARHSAADVVIGTRVVRPGGQIRRRLRRYVLGRTFALAASAVLGTWLCDTQCGAKFFKNTARLQRALGRTFVSRWIFDVELLGRILGDDGSGDLAGDLRRRRIEQEPLRRWTEVPGGKLRPADLARASVELLQVAMRLRGRAMQTPRNP